MKYIKKFENISFLNIYNNIIKDLDIGDYVIIESPRSDLYKLYENRIGEIVDMSESQVYVYFDNKNMIWIKKEYIIKNSKIKNDIKEYIDIKNDSKKYNL